MSRPAALLCSLAVLAVVAALAAAAWTGALMPRALLDPGALVRWGSVVVTAGRDIAIAVTLGGLALLTMVLPPPATAVRVRRNTHPELGDAGAAQRDIGAAQRSGRLAPRFQLTHRPHQRRVHATGAGHAWARVRSVTAIAAVAWAGLQILDVLVTHLAVTGSATSDPTYGAQLWQFLTEIDLGRNLGLAALFAAITAVAVVALSTMTAAGWALVLVCVALVPLALTGHAAGATDHNLAVSGIYLHFLGIGTWAGGAAVLAGVRGSLGRDLPDAARRFSTVAGWSVVIVLVSGISAAWLRIETFSQLLTHPYGMLLSAKILATAALMAAGWYHRQRLLPRIDQDTPAARRGFTRLLTGEAIVMAATAGLGVAMASSAPPVAQEAEPDPSPVFALSRYPEPPPPSFRSFFTEWQLDPLISLVLVTALVLYLRWVWRLRARGDEWSTWRTVSWVAGIAGLFYTVQGGPAVYGRVLFSVHMAEHMALAMLLPMLLVVGAPVTLIMRAVPSRTDGSRSGRDWLHGIVSSRWAQWWAHPIVAAINFFGSLFLFYYTDLFRLALTTHPGHLLMILHFVLAGYMFANALIGIDPHPGRPPYFLRVILLLATMAGHAFFAVSIFSLTTLLVPDYFGWLGLSWGVDALADQGVGGMITWGVGELPTVAMMLGVGVLWARDDDRSARRYDRRSDRDGDAELEAYNAMLAQRAGSTSAARAQGAVGDRPRHNAHADRTHS